MISVTNKSLRHAITINGKTIKPQESYSFEKVDMNKINYYVSTGDIEIKYVESSERKIKSVSRKPQVDDTIIIESSDAATAESEDIKSKNNKYLK